MSLILKKNPIYLQLLDNITRLVKAHIHQIIIVLLQIRINRTGIGAVGHQRTFNKLELVNHWRKRGQTHPDKKEPREHTPHPALPIHKQTEQHKKKEHQIEQAHLHQAVAADRGYDHLVNVDQRQTPRVNHHQPVEVRYFPDHSNDKLKELLLSLGLLVAIRWVPWDADDILGREFRHLGRIRWLWNGCLELWQLQPRVIEVMYLNDDHNQEGGRDE